MVVLPAELGRTRMCGRTFGRGSGFTTCCPLIELDQSLRTGQHEKTENNMCVKSPPFGLQTTTLPLLLKF